MVSKTVCVSIDVDLWKEAQFNSLSWAAALETGLRLMLGNSGDRRKLEEKIADLDIKTKYYQEKLGEVIAQEKKMAEKRIKEKANVEAYNKFLSENADVIKIAKKKFKDEPTIYGVYDQWNTLNKRYMKRFGNSFSQKEFVKMLEERK